MVDANTVTFWLSEVLQPAKIADQARKGIETEVFLLYQKGRDPRIFQAGPVSGNACIGTGFGINIGNSHPAKRATSVLNRSVTKCQ
jgi:hypothetical protein